MLSVINGVLQLILLILSTWREKDEAKKKQKEALRDELEASIKSGSAVSINHIIGRIRRM